MRSIMSKWGKHIAAIAVFLVLTVIYFSPAVFEGKVVRQGDTEKAIGMGNSQMDEYEKTAQPGEFSAWSDAMFGGMPYVSGYGNPAPRFPGYLLVEKPLKALGYMDAGMVFTGFVCFYILMCVMGVNWSVKLPFDKKGSPSWGYKPKGKAWYRKQFVLGEELKDKNITLEFDGAAKDCFVYFNGSLLKRHYTSTPIAGRAGGTRARGFTAMCALSRKKRSAWRSTAYSSARALRTAFGAAPRR